MHNVIHGLNIPYAENYLGAWAMNDPEFNALRQQVESLNVQLHLSAVANGEHAASIQARASTEYELVADGSIAIIQVQGTIMKHAGSMSSNASTVALRRQVRHAAASPNVKGILLHVDSPGGSVKGIHDLADDINEARAKKPLWSYVEDMAASGGYWLASQSDRLVANPSVLLGSIGVFQIVYDVSRAAENEGIATHVIKAGKFKAVGVPGAPITEEQLADLQRTVDSYYSDFVDAVAKGRRMPREKALALADGRIHKGSEAMSLGLSDALMSFDAMLSEFVSDIEKKSKQGAKRMANETTQEPQARAATITELRRACQGASDSFILAQMELQATVTDAMAAFIQEQRAANEQLAKEKAEAEKAAERAAAASATQTRGKSPGVPALGDSKSDSDQADGDPAAEYLALSKKIHAENPKLTWAECCHRAGRQNPAGREAYQLTCPAARPPAARMR